MLITIVIITYNSSKYVIQTLDSAFRQTYSDIELVISDDCSTDDTMELCQQWVDSHKDRFIRTIVSQTPKNSGICANYNHALKLATGEYIKYIAGDDILYENCIERFVANIHPDTFLYTCIAGHLNNNTEKIAYFKTRLPNSTARKQARYMLKYHYGINGPTIFVERNHLLLLGGFEEQYPMIEDWPIAIKYVTSGYRIGIIDEPLVLWRLYDNSISHSSHCFADDLYRAKYDYSMKYCNRYGLLLHKYHYWVNHWILFNSDRDFCHKLFGYLLRLFDIINIYRHFANLSQNPYQKIK